MRNSLTDEVCIGGKEGFFTPAEIGNCRRCIDGGENASFVIGRDDRLLKGLRIEHGVFSENWALGESLAGYNSLSSNFLDGYRDVVPRTTSVFFT